MVTFVITAAGLIVYGSKENKAVLRHLALIHRKIASSLFLEHESPFAGCGVWRVAEVKGAGDRSLAGGLPLALEGRGSSSHPPHWPGVGITEWEPLQE